MGPSLLIQISFLFEKICFKEHSNDEKELLQAQVSHLDGFLQAPCMPILIIYRRQQIAPDNLGIGTCLFDGKLLQKDQYIRPLP
jgi:hypothetical protein